MKVVRETCVAGKTILRAVRVVNKNTSMISQRRGERIKPSRDAVLKVNQRNAERSLTMKMNNNFKGGDLHITLTYKTEPTAAEAKKDKEKFLRRLKYRFEKTGAVLKRIDVTEYENKRIHHHIVISYIEPAVIEKLWDKGWVKVSVLDDSGNYKRLAEYLIKETSKTFRNPDCPNKRRYNCSNNIVTPAIKREEVSAREVNKELKPLKGYYIDMDSVRKYEHAITKIECLEYIMVSLDDEPRLKKWNKGRDVKIRNTSMSVAEVNEQMGIGDVNW